MNFGTSQTQTTAQDAARAWLSTNQIPAKMVQMRTQAGVILTPKLLIVGSSTWHLSKRESMETLQPYNILHEHVP